MAHILNSKLLIAKATCSLTVHIFLITLIIFTITLKPSITAQIVKNNPGGVTYRKYLFEIYAFLLPNKYTIIIDEMSQRKLKARIGHDFLPYIPRSPFLLSY